MRPLCKCGIRVRAVNYKKGNKTYYRKLCEVCSKNGVYHGIPRWYRSGYRMKNACDKCGIKSDHNEIFRVFHIDGNLDNCSHRNLKTICSNCMIVLAKQGVRWKQGDLTPDY